MRVEVGGCHFDQEVYVDAGGGCAAVERFLDNAADSGGAEKVIFTDEVVSVPLE